jgi:hypothetical protein
MITGRHGRPADLRGLVVQGGCAVADATPSTPLACRTPRREPTPPRGSAGSERAAPPTRHGRKGLARAGTAGYGRYRSALQIRSTSSARTAIPDRSTTIGNNGRDLPRCRQIVVRGAGGVQGEPVRGPLTPHRTVAPRAPPAPLDTTHTTPKPASIKEGPGMVGGRFGAGTNGTGGYESGTDPTRHSTSLDSTPWYRPASVYAGSSGGEHQPRPAMPFPTRTTPMTSSSTAITVALL